MHLNLQFIHLYVITALGREEFLWCL